MIFSPLRVSVKLVGSFKAGCCGPIGIWTFERVPEIIPGGKK